MPSLLVGLNKTPVAAGVAVGQGGNKGVGGNANLQKYKKFFSNILVSVQQQC